MSRRVIIVLLVASGLLWFKHYVPGLHTANEYIRLYAVLAMAEHHTARLDPVFDRLAPGWRERGTPPNVDVAMVADAAGQEHFYLDKAPLPSLMAVPLHYVLRNFIDPWREPELEVWWLALLLSGFPALLFLFLLGRRASPGEAWALLSLGFASPFLIYAGLWFGHLTAGLLAYGGYALLKRDRFLLGGLALGASVLCDYPVGVLAGSVLLVQAFSVTSWRARLLPFLGFGVALAFQGVYNGVVFGDPLTFAYAHKYSKTFSEFHGSGLFGVGLPDLLNLLRLWFSPERGLFFLAPVLLVAVPGVILLERDPELHWRERVLPMVALLIPALVLSGFVDWKAGNAAGPRHLVSILPFLAAPMMRATERATKASRPWALLLIAAAMTLSLFHVWVVRATFPYLSTRLVNPVYHQSLPLFIDACRYPPILGRALSDFVLVALLPPLMVVVTLVLGAKAEAERSRRFILSAGLVLGLLLSPAFMSVGAGSAALPELAARESHQVQMLHGCPRTDTAFKLTGGTRPVEPALAPRRPSSVAPTQE